MKKGYVVIYFDGMNWKEKLTYLWQTAQAILFKKHVESKVKYISIGKPTKEK